MKFILIHTWEPHERNEIGNRRLEKGLMLLKGIKVPNEWLMYRE